MTHDFKSSLDSINKCTDKRGALSYFEFSDVMINEIHAIRAALRIADKLMDEPSDEMLQSAYESLGWDFTNDFGFRHSFKSMRDQMLRELNISTDPVSIPSAADTSQNVEYENG